MTSALGLKAREAPSVTCIVPWPANYEPWKLEFAFALGSDLHTMSCILSRHSTKKEIKMLIAGTKTGFES